MSATSAGPEIPFQPRSASPAVAAAVTVLPQASAPGVRSLASALLAVAPHLTDLQRQTWTAALSPRLGRAALTTPRRIAAFLGQCAIESGGFRQLEEDLTYSADRLCQVWPSHFPTLEAARTCAARPETLANTVYANRLGNGDAASGDGWRFRGRGLIQLTGRAAYERFAKATGRALDQAVACAAMPEGAVESAAWFWSANTLNRFADAWMLDNLTKAINGGLLQASERARLSEAALHAMEH